MHPHEVGPLPEGLSSRSRRCRTQTATSGVRKMFHPCSRPLRSSMSAARSTSRLNAWILVRRSGSVNRRLRLGRRRSEKCPDPPTSRNPGDLERNTGFEPATFALARRTDLVTNGPRSSPTITNPAKSFRLRCTGRDGGSPTIPNHQQRSCSTGVPRRRSATRRCPGRGAPRLDEGCCPSGMPTRRPLAPTRSPQRLPHPLLRRGYPDRDPAPARMIQTLHEDSCRQTTKSSGTRRPTATRLSIAG